MREHVNLKLRELLEANLEEMKLRQAILHFQRQIEHKATNAQTKRFCAKLMNGIGYGRAKNPLTSRNVLENPHITTLDGSVLAELHKLGAKDYFFAFHYFDNKLVQEGNTIFYITAAGDTVPDEE
jgi:hypothetical protein